jgi:hypothetical protein
MSWQDIRQRVLPPVGGVLPHDTSRYGATNRPRGSTNPHRGVDFNYDVGPGGQKGINLTHPALRSPVTGIVTNAGEGTAGTIAITDANGFVHEILHTHTRHVAVGDPVVAGQLIGTMGNTGVESPNIEHGAHHVHYQLKDSTGTVIDPSAFWDQQGPVDPNPAPPAYLDEYQQYSQLPNQALPPDRSNSVDSRFGNWPAAPFVSAPDAGLSAAPSPPAIPDRNVPVLRSRVAGKPGASFFDNVNQAVPFVPSNEVLSPGRPASFADRFGDWTSFPTGSAPPGPNQPVPPAEDGSSRRGDAGNIRVLTGRLVSRNGAGNPSISPAGFSNQPGPLSQAGRPLGPFTGEPMPNDPLPPSIWDFLDNSRSPRDDREDRFNRWIRPLLQR